MCQPRLVLGARHLIGVLLGQAGVVGALGRQHLGEKRQFGQLQRREEGRFHFPEVGAAAILPGLAEVGVEGACEALVEQRAKRVACTGARLQVVVSRPCTGPIMSRGMCKSRGG